MNRRDREDLKEVFRFLRLMAVVFIALLMMGFALWLIASRLAKQNVDMLRSSSSDSEQSR